MTTNELKLTAQVKRLQRHNKTLRFLVSQLSGAAQTDLNTVSHMLTTMGQVMTMLETKEAKTGTQMTYHIHLAYMGLLKQRFSAADEFRCWSLSCDCWFCMMNKYLTRRPNE